MDRGTHRITELAAIVPRDTEQIGSYLSQNNLASPSFDIDAFLDWPEVLRSARKAVVEATQELNSLMLGPKKAVKSELVSPSSGSLQSCILFLPDFAPCHHSGPKCHKQLQYPG